MTVQSIVIPITRFTASGGNRVLCRLATEWTRAGLDVAFLVLDPKSLPTFDTTARVICALDIKRSLRVSTDSKLGVLREILNLARAIRAVRDDFDVVLANFAFTALSCALAGVRRKTLYYVQCYDPEVLASRGTPSRWAAAALAYVSYWLCRWQVVNSPHYFGYSGISATQFIPPGVDTSVFVPKDGPFPNSSRELLVGIIGRSEPHKFRPALEAWRNIRAKHPRSRLLVAFGANLPPDALADAPPLEIVTPSGDSELAAFYRRCDVFLALSDFPQGAFYPPLEALASGTCLIANRFLYVSEANSWPIDSPGDAVTRLNDILTCGDKVLKSKRDQGLKDVASTLAWPVIGARFLDLMNQRAGSTGENP